MLGILKTYFPKRGFGFIKSLESDQDFFFHIKSCSIPEEKLVEGLEVQFEIGQHPVTYRELAQTVSLRIK